MNVLLVGVPEGVCVVEITTSICAKPGAANTHDLDVWSISSGKTSLSVPVVSADAPLTWPTLLSAVRTMLADLKFAIRPCELKIHRARSASGLSRTVGKDVPSCVCGLRQAIEKEST